MSEVNESGAQVDAKAETSASMSESRRSDEDVIEFDDQVLGPQVVTSSETGRLARDDTNLRRRKPPFQQGIEVPEYEPGNQTLNPPPKSPEGGEVEGDSLGVEEISEGEQKDLLYETTETEGRPPRPSLLLHDLHLPCPGVLPVPHRLAAKGDTRAAVQNPVH